MKLSIDICPGSGVFKTFVGNVPFRAIIGTGKKNFSKHFLISFQVTKCFFGIIAFKHDFLIHLHLLGPSGGIENPAFQARVLTTPLGPSRMHRKSCLIPISHYCFDPRAACCCGTKTILIELMTKLLNQFILQHFDTSIKSMSCCTTKPTKWLCTQRRLRSAWASTQSDQSLRCALNGQLRTQAFFIRTAKILIRLGWCLGWSESPPGTHAILLVLSWGGS